jgi:hypothetical protein
MNMVLKQDNGKNIIRTIKPRRFLLAIWIHEHFRGFTKIVNLNWTIRICSSWIEQGGQ